MTALPFDLAWTESTDTVTGDQTFTLTLIGPDGDVDSIRIDAEDFGDDDAARVEDRLLAQNGLTRAVVEQVIDGI